MAWWKNGLLLLCLFCLFFSILHGKHHHHRHHRPLPKVGWRDAAPWRNLTLSKEFTFPLPVHFQKVVRVHGLYEVIAAQGNGSIGCVLSQIPDWYENAPPSFCSPEELKTVYVFSEQRSGTTLLTHQMSQLSSVLSFHEPFCCDRCENPDKGVLAIPKVVCSFGFRDIGIRTLTLGLQKKQFWKHTEMTYNVVTQNNIPSIFLVRQNTLARRLSSRGFSRRESASKIKLTLTRDDILDLIEDSESQKDHANLYCSLKRAGVTTYFTTYEKLNLNFTETMLDVAEVLIDKREGPWNGTATPGKGHVLSTTISKIENVEEVREWLRELSPERECYLDNNCEYFYRGEAPDCSEEEYTIFGEGDLPDRPRKKRRDFLLKRERRSLENSP